MSVWAHISALIHCFTIYYCLVAGAQAQQHGAPGAAIPTQGASSQSAAALAAAATPARFPAEGIIDPYAADSSDEPGVLVPLAQSQASIDHWLDAVEVAGSATPLANPLFEGTVFIPSDEAFEELYPQLKRSGENALEVFSRIPMEELAARLNSLTVPGLPLREHDLQSEAVLQAAGGVLLQALPVRTPSGLLQLHTSANGPALTIVEPDLQSGCAIAHVIDKFAGAIAASRGSKAPGPNPGYASAIEVLQDPAMKLDLFAELVQAAGMKDILSGATSEFTLFAPTNQAMLNLFSQLPVGAKTALLSTQSWADELTSAHMVAGVALGTQALRALPLGNCLHSQAGHVQVQLRSHAYSVGLVQESAALLKPTAASPSVGAGPATTPGDVSIAVVGGNIICGDVAAGKAVVHVVDKVILTPGIAHQLGVPLKGMDPHHNAARSTRSSHQHHWQLAAVAAATVVVMVAGAV